MARVLFESIRTLKDSNQLVKIVREHPLGRNSLVVVDITSELLLGKLKLACEDIWNYAILSDRRLVVVG